MPAGLQDAVAAVLAALVECQGRASGCSASRLAAPSPHRAVGSRQPAGGAAASGAAALRGVSAAASRLGALRAPLAEGAGRIGGAATAAGPALAERVDALREPVTRWAWRAAVTAAVVAVVAGVGWPALRYWQSLESAPAEEPAAAPAPEAARGGARPWRTGREPPGDCA